MPLFQSETCFGETDVQPGTPLPSLPHIHAGPCDNEMWTEARAYETLLCNSLPSIFLPLADGR